MKFRVGRHNNRTVYFQTEDEPSNADRLVCTTQNRDGAKVLVIALNYLLRKMAVQGTARRVIGYSISEDVSDVSTWEERQFIPDEQEAP